MTLCATAPNIHKTFVISVVAFEIFTIKDQTLKVDLEQEVQGRQGKYYTGIVTTMPVSHTKSLNLIGLKMDEIRPLTDIKM